VTVEPAGVASGQASATVPERIKERRPANDHAPFIDFENLPAPSEGFLVTQFITVRSVARSRAFYPRSSAASDAPVTE
jgi:hypothetical protein